MSRDKVPDFRSRCRGCMLGLAIGDALGAPVEGMMMCQIRGAFGDDGITDLHPWRDHPAGSVTDDTQMSLATAEALVRTKAAGDGELLDAEYAPAVWAAYLDWLVSQDDPRHRRGPGRTCLTALATGTMGTIEKPINDSKGCGGVMRVAPAGLAFRPEEAFRQAAAFAAITHGHPSGYLSSAALAAIVSHVIEGLTLREAAAGAMKLLENEEGAHETVMKLDEAMRFVERRAPPERALAVLGEGWVGEEALAIAFFCAGRYPDDLRQALFAAVNHSGDSDSTGSIAGAIVGAWLGEEGIPAEWSSKIEAKEKLVTAADEIWWLFPRG